jgi:hypothetical protein
VGVKKPVFILGMFGLAALGGLILAYVLIGISQEEDKPRTVASPSPSATMEFLPSPTQTATLSNTPTATSTPTQTALPTLATRIASLSIIMPDVTLPPSATPLPENLQILAEAPAPIEPLYDATLLPFPYTDFTEWASFESDHPAIRYTSGSWTPLQSSRASQGQYHFTEDTDALVQFTFIGEAVRVRYIGFTNGGIWHLVIDEEIVETIDAYAPIGTFTGTDVYTLSPGEHTIELRNTEDANPASSGHMLAFDAVQVYHSDALTLIVPGGVLPSATPTSTLIPAQDIELIAAPPSPQPTATTIPVQEVSASIVIGYDENANGTLDVSEGVRGISVRLVEVGTNHVLAHAFTDEQGFAQLQAATHASVLLVVPYFSESWTISPRNSSTTQTFTLLLSPGNQPGLIP